MFNGKQKQDQQAPELKENISKRIKKRHVEKRNLEKKVKETSK